MMLKSSDIRSSSQRSNRCRLAVEKLDDRILPASHNALGAGMHPMPISPPGSHIQGGGAASFTQIPLPDAAYQASTTKIALTSSLGTFDSSITDGTQTVYMDRGGFHSRVGVSWATWSSPPQSEDARPDLLFVTDNTLFIALDSPVNTFGVEMEPNTFDPTFDITAYYYDAGFNFSGAITQNMSGRADAKLFAATIDATMDAPFEYIYISADPAAQGFGIAQFRYDQSQLGGAPHGHGAVAQIAAMSTTHDVTLGTPVQGSVTHQADSVPVQGLDAGTKTLALPASTGMHVINSGASADVLTATSVDMLFQDVLS